MDFGYVFIFYQSFVSYGFNISLSNQNLILDSLHP